VSAEKTESTEGEVEKKGERSGRSRGEASKRTNSDRRPSLSLDQDTEIESSIFLGVVHVVVCSAVFGEGRRQSP
jgi:hypothetical protein